MEDLARERAHTTFDVETMKIIWAGGQQAFELHHKLASAVANDPVFRKEDKPKMTRKELFISGIRKAAHCRELALELGLSEDDARTLRMLRDDKAYDDLHWNMFVPVLRTQATAEQQQKWLPLATSMSVIGCYAQTEIGHGSNVQGLETTATFDPSTDGFILNSPTLTSTKWWPGGLGKVATHAIVHARLILDRDYGVHAFIVQIRSMEDHKPLTTITVGDIGQKFGNGGNNTVDNGFVKFNNTRIPRDHLLMRMAIVTKEGKYVRQNVPKQILYGGMIAARQIILMEASVCLSRAVTIAVRYSAVRRQFSLDNGNREIQVLDYPTQQQKIFPLLASAYAFRFVGQWMESLYSEVMYQFENDNFSALAEIHACTSGIKALTTSVTADAIEKCRKACGGHGYLCASGLPELFAAYIPACTYEGDNTILFIQVGKFLVKMILNMKTSSRPQGTTQYLADLDLHTTKDCEVSDDMFTTSNVNHSQAGDAAIIMANAATIPINNPSSDDVRLYIPGILYHVICKDNPKHVQHIPLTQRSLRSNTNNEEFTEEEVANKDAGIPSNSPSSRGNYHNQNERNSANAPPLRCVVIKEDDWLNSNVILGAFEARAARLALSISRHIQKFPDQDVGFEELSVDLVSVARAHCQLIVLSKFIDKLHGAIPDLNVKKQLQLLCNTYGLSLVCEHVEEFLVTGYMTKRQANLARHQLRSLLSDVRPNAIALVDSFDHTDHYLGSVLGRYDGDVYTHLYREALKDPFNNSAVTEGYKEYIEPIIKQRLHSSKL